MKAFADNNFNVAQMVKFFCDRVENIKGKGENAGYQMFLKGFFLRVVKTQDYLGKVTLKHNPEFNPLPYNPTFNDPKKDGLRN